MTDILEPCCHGFIHTTEQLPGSSWTTQVAHPFRARWIWLWSDPWYGVNAAVLRSICIGEEEQLLQPMPFAAMKRTLEREAFVALVTFGPNVERIKAPGDRESLLFKGARVHPSIARDCGQHEAAFREAAVGEQLSMQASGGVRGMVLVGHQLVPAAPPADPEKPV